MVLDTAIFCVAQCFCMLAASCSTGPAAEARQLEAHGVASGAGRGGRAGGHPALDAAIVAVAVQVELVFQGPRISPSPNKSEQISIYLDVVLQDRDIEIYRDTVVV